MYKLFRTKRGGAREYYMGKADSKEDLKAAAKLFYLAVGTQFEVRDETGKIVYRRVEPAPNVTYRRVGEVVAPAGD